MTIFQRIKTALGGLGMILSCFLMILLPSLGYSIILLILSLSLFVYGIKTLAYYCTFARHMVGGRGILYIGIVVLDLGIFSLTMADNSVAYILIYLLAFRAFSGLVDILRALEERRNASRRWKGKLGIGIANILLAFTALLAGMIFRSESLLVDIYCLGLFASGVSNIVTAFRKSAIVYIQ